MANQNLNSSEAPVYFEVFRAVNRGGLSLWLNRRAFLPMTLIPTIVTFLTIMIMRTMNVGEGTELSGFTLALLKIPSDFVTGLLSAVIIYIILNAPRKGDNDKPALFVLNITERKDLLIAAAIIHVILGYFAAGLFTVSEMVTAPIQADLQANVEPQIGIEAVLGTFGIMLIFLYGIRLLLLPILIFGDWDIIGFYKYKSGFGLSVPILLVKALTAFTAGFFALIILALFQGVEQTDGMPQNPFVMGIIDFAASWLSVIATIWCYASLTVGFRQMTEKAQKS